MCVCVCMCVFCLDSTHLGHQMETQTKINEGQTREEEIKTDQA